MSSVPLVQNHNKEQHKELNIFILFMIYTSYSLLFRLTYKISNQHNMLVFKKKVG